MEHLIPTCDNCGGTEFEQVVEPDTEREISATEYFAMLAAGTPIVGEPSARTARCLNCDLQYPC